MTGKAISGLLGAPGPFYRSVSIERDRHDLAAGRSYVLTPWLERSVGELLDGLKPGSTRRAWRIVGDFGVGKSALVLALIQALDPRTAGAQPALADLIGQAGAMPRMYSLVLSGSRDGLSAGLAAALASALDEVEDLLSPGQRQALRDADPFDAVVELRDLLVASGRFDGLLLVIDEMGKFLETAALSPEFGDIFRLQALAEQAARSEGKPLAIMLVLHQGFQSYAEEGSFARRTEWAKIAERFDELIFDHPLSHTAALLGAALNVAPLPAKTAAAYEAAVGRVRELGWLGPRDASSGFACYPIHPSTVPVMARFFAAFGQNERSLFGFAASGEANGLRAFAAGNGVDAGFYRPDHFFDYVASSFGHRLVSRGGGGGDWDRIRSVLDGAEDADTCETALLKTIGLLNLVDAPDLPASAEALGASLAPNFGAGEIEAAIGRLGKRGLLFQRPGRPGLRLWTSRRVDLSALWSEASRELPSSAIAGALARHLARLPVRGHLLARRHSIERGTSRRFVVRLVAASALALTEPGVGADGSVICILTGSQDDLRHAKAWAKEVTERDPAVLALVAPPMPEAAPLMTSLMQHRWMITHAAALQEDSFAAAEIERGAADLETRLVTQLEAAFGLGGHAPHDKVCLFHGGSRQKSAPPVHILISRLCDTLFGDAPRVANELINRHALTSAGAGARQRLIEAIFAHEADPDLGFDTARNPPERALYLSVIRRGKLHRPVGKSWAIAIPEKADDPLNLRPTLTKLERLLSANPDRVRVSAIYEELARRPLGIRLGFAPLLLAAVLAANRHRVALFERGTYCPKLDGAAFMRILKSPELFELQWVSLEGIRADVFRRLATVVEGGDVEAGMLSVVTPLIRFAADLPYHVHRTAAIDPVAAAVRDALLSARSPVDLIFSGLPLACGVMPFDPGESEGDRARVQHFIERLEGAIAELRGSYPALLTGMRAELAELTGAVGHVRGDLQRRAATVLFRVQEQTLRTFCLRLADEGLSDDAWIEALGGAVMGKPPTRWLTADVALWRARLDELASAFRRVEAACFAAGPCAREAVRLSLTHVDGREHAVVIDFADADEREDVFANSILRLIDESDFAVDRILAALSLKAVSEREAPTQQEPAGRAEAGQ